jgi:hypothetical protein
VRAGASAFAGSIPSRAIRLGSRRRFLTRSPLRMQIEARDATRLHEITEAATAAIARPFGPGPIEACARWFSTSASRRYTSVLPFAAILFPRYAPWLRPTRTTSAASTSGYDVAVPATKPPRARIAVTT